MYAFFLSVVLYSSCLIDLVLLRIPYEGGKSLLQRSPLQDYGKCAYFRVPQVFFATLVLTCAILCFPASPREDVPGLFSLTFQQPSNRREKKVYTKGVYSSENSSESASKKQVWCIPKSLFSRGKDGNYMDTKEASRCFVGDPFAQYWCIDFGLLSNTLHNPF